MLTTPDGSSGSLEIDLAIGHALRSARKDRGLSQASLAHSVRVSQQQLQKYEKGKNRVSAMMLIRLAAALEMQPSALLPIQADKVSATCELRADQRALLEAYDALNHERRMALLVLAQAAEL
ncbi:MAG: helix-turn-helix domain-containing protein [Caulobacteraceae bacterium]